MLSFRNGGLAARRIIDGKQLTENNTPSYARPPKDALQRAIPAVAGLPPFLSSAPHDGVSAFARVSLTTACG